MLEYSKLILSKMTFDKKLFKKEVRKAFRYLNREERRQLIIWVRSKSESESLAYSAAIKFSFLHRLKLKSTSIP